MLMRIETPVFLTLTDIFLFRDFCNRAIVLKLLSLRRIFYKTSETKIEVVLVTHDSIEPCYDWVMTMGINANPCPNWV